MSGTHPKTVDDAAKEGYTLSDMIPGKYVACLYDQQWWIGNICAISDEEQDVQVQFMHPHGPAKSFSQPRREDICWVPMIHIIKIIDAPITSTGRQYVVQSSAVKEVEHLLKCFK